MQQDFSWNIDYQDKSFFTYASQNNFHLLLIIFIFKGYALTYGSNTKMCLKFKR